MEPTRTLYVRNVPDRLLRTARARAARDGITLGALVVQALEEKTSGPKANVPELADDMAWYEAHRRELEADHDGEYVAIVGGRVADHDADFDALASRVFAAHGVRSIYMPHVQRSERIVAVRGPRRA